MLRVLLGDSTGDPEAIAEAARSRKQVSWMVPKSSVVGDEVVFVLPERGFSAFGVIMSPPVPDDELVGWYRASVGDIRLLPRPVPVPFIREHHPEWKWATYPRSYTTIDGAIESRLRQLLDQYGTTKA